VPDWACRELMYRVHCSALSARKPDSSSRALRETGHPSKLTPARRYSSATACTRTLIAHALHTRHSHSLGHPRIHIKTRRRYESVPGGEETEAWRFQLRLLRRRRGERGGAVTARANAPLAARTRATPHHLHHYLHPHLHSLPHVEDGECVKERYNSWMIGQAQHIPRIE